LGFQTQSRDDALSALAAAECAVLIGERITEILGVEALAELSKSIRLIVFDTHALQVSATNACIGIPNAAERTGTWINVDGHAGRIAAAKPAPQGVAPLTRSLEEIRAALAPVAGEVGS
jgi:hypothetical protein